MSYFRCSSVDGMELPDQILIDGSASSGGIDGSGNVKSGNGSVTIPTMGYRYADIDASSSSVGTGNNIDISNYATITVSRSYAVNVYHHQNPDGSWGSYYGGGSGSYSVVLHN